MKFTAAQIAEYLGGTVEGNHDAEVETFAKIEEGQVGALSFLANPKYTHYIYTTQSSIVLVNRDFEPEHEVKTTLVRVDNAYEAIARLLTLYESMTQKREGIHPLAFVSEKAELGEACYVGPFAYIGDNVKVGAGTQIYPHAVIEESAVIGENCIIYPNVSVYHECCIGNGCIIHSGAVIGADGFGFAPAAEGYEKIPQIGIVTIEDNVEIGANTCIDRSTMGSTVVHHGAKIDNLVQLAHNVEVGSHTVMAAQSGVAGSTKVGEWCMFAGQVGIAGHLQIGDRNVFGAQTGVSRSYPKSGGAYMGSPAMEHRKYARITAYTRGLGDLNEEVKALRDEIETLKAKLEGQS